MAVFLTIRSRTAIMLVMARPKEFDREDALRRAIPVFWKKGFARTSTEDLVAAMGIGKQSLYDTFGDKRGLFLEALRTYNSEGVASLVKRVAGGCQGLQRSRASSSSSPMNNRTNARSVAWESTRSASSATTRTCAQSAPWLLRLSRKR